MGLFDRIKKAIKKVANTVSNAASKVKKTISNVVKKAKDVGKRVVQSPTTRDIVKRTISIVTGVSDVAAKITKRAYRATKRLISSRRIRDEKIRDRAVEKSARSLARSTKDLSRATDTINRVRDTVRKTTSVVSKRIDEEQKRIEEENKKTESELDSIKDQLKKAIDRISWAGMYGTWRLIAELIFSYVTKSKERAEKALREFMSVQVEQMKHLPLLLAILAAIAGGPAEMAFFRILTLFASWFGSASFARWLIEESMQRTMIQIDEARKRGLVDEVRKGIELNKEMTKWAKKTTDIVVKGPLAVWEALDYFYKANDYALEQTMKMLELDMLAQAEIYPGNIAKVLEIAQEKANKGEDLKKEDIEQWLPRVVLLPPAFKTTIQDYKQELLSIKMDIIALIDDGEYERALDRLKDFKNKLDEFKSWVESRRAILEQVDEYKKQLDYINSLEAWHDDQVAKCKEESAPHATLIITCSLWPERLYLDESPIEPKPYVEVDVVPGKHIIRAEKEGYHADAVTVEVKEDERKVVRIDFEKKPQGYGYLTIITTPDCDVYIGSNPTPLHTPVYRYELPPGKYDIRLVREGYREEEVTVLISEGIEQRVEKTLERIVEEVPTKGSLVVITNPAGAFVTVDGLTHPYKTPTVLLLDPGTHSIKVEKEGYKVIEDTAEIIAGESTRKEYELEPLEELISYRVYIDSEPRGAMIFLDGVYTGRRTPATLSLGKGTWTIRLELSGYYPAEKTITLR